MVRIYFERSCGSKFDGESVYLDNLSPENGVSWEYPCILFSHETGLEEIERHKKECEPAVLSGKMAICYISGAPHCGLKDKPELDEFEKQYGGFIHLYDIILENIPEGRNQTVAFLTRLRGLIDDSKRFGPVLPPNWQLLYPPSYPESLVSAYLILIAEREGLIIDDLDGTSLWSEAGKEFNSLRNARGLKNDVDLIPAVGWAHPSGSDNVNKTVDVIRRLFELVNQGQ